MSTPLGLITGGLSGIGAATAEEFGKLGARLVLLDISGDASRVESRVRGAGGHATAVTCDVSRPSDVEAAVNSAVAEIGGLNFAVINAGIAEQSLLATGNPERWAEVVSTNLLGSMNTIRAALPFMRRQGHGHILVVASVSGREPYVGEPAYIASKFGLVGLTHALRMEAADYGVRVTVVEPGTVATPHAVISELVIRPLNEPTNELPGY